MGRAGKETSNANSTTATRVSGDDAAPVERWRWGRRLSRRSSEALAPRPEGPRKNCERGKRPRTRRRRTLKPRRSGQERGACTSGPCGRAGSARSHRDAVWGGRDAARGRHRACLSGVQQVRLRSGREIRCPRQFHTGRRRRPAKWNTNGSGEIVTVTGKPGRWLRAARISVKLEDGKHHFVHGGAGHDEADERRPHCVGLRHPGERRGTPDRELPCSQVSSSSMSGPDVMFKRTAGTPSRVIRPRRAHS